MQVDRRTMMAGGGGGARAGPALAQQPRAPRRLVRPAIVIDALGGVGDPYSPDEQLRLGDRGWAEMVATGVTVASRHGDAGRQCRRSVGRLSKGHRGQAEHPQRQPRPAAAGPQRRRHPQGQAREEVRRGPRHAGHVDGRARARPACADEEGRGDDRPADLQQPQPRRATARSSRPMPACRSSGKATIERIEAEKLLLDLSHGGARTMAEAAALRNGRWSSAIPAHGR